MKLIRLSVLSQTRLWILQYFFIFTIFLLGNLWATSSWAACLRGQFTTITPNASLTFFPTELKVPASAKLGQEIDSALINTVNSVFYDCSENSARDFTTNTLIGTGVSTPYTNVCESGIPGIGISVWGDGSVYNWNVVNSRTMSDVNLVSFPTGMGCNVTTSVSGANKTILRVYYPYTGGSGSGFYVRFVKISEAARPGTYTLGNIVSITAAGYQLMKIGQPSTPIKISIVEDPKCQVVAGQNTVNVPMGKIDVQALKSGQARDVAFSLPLNCSAGAQTMLSVVLPSTTGSGMLAVNDGINSATGVGIALSHQGNPVSSGQKISLSSFNPVGIFNVPFSARYTAVGSEVKPGLANATMTFTLEQP